MTVKKKLKDGRFTILPPLAPNNPDPESVNWRRVDESVLAPFPGPVPWDEDTPVPEAQPPGSTKGPLPHTPITLYPQST
jgi:hypothetical protein